MDFQWPVDPPFQDLSKGNVPWEIRSSYCGVDDGFRYFRYDWYVVVRNVKDLDLNRGKWSGEYVAYSMFWLYSHFQTHIAIACFKSEVYVVQWSTNFPKIWEHQKVMVRQVFYRGSTVWKWPVNLSAAWYSAWCMVTDILFFVHKVTDCHNYAANIGCHYMQCSQLGNQVFKICAPLILFIVRNVFKEWLKRFVKNPAYKANLKNFVFECSKHLKFFLWKAPRKSNKMKVQNCKS
jgi:hypothetical protein